MPLSQFLLLQPRVACSCLRASAVVAVTVACLAASHTIAPAQTVDTNLWVTNGTVFSVVRDGGTIYIGGYFTQVGPATGGGVPIDAGSGGLPPSFPKVLGNVKAVAPDGAGGWYIGGSFTSVGGTPRSNLAHVAEDLSVSPWDPNVGGTRPYVYALAVSGSRIYAGGQFTSIGGQTRNHIAAIDAVTGAATAWDANAGNASGYVYALAVNGTTVYAGGAFTSIGGQSRNHIAALDTATGAATDWNPNANDAIFTLGVSGATVYAGGFFSSIGGQARHSIAALNAATGVATAWNPNPAGGAYGVYPSVRSLAVNGTTVYAAGNFISIGGQTRNYIAALDAATGAATAWNPNANSEVNALTVSGSTVYAGGVFSSIGGQGRNYIAALDVATGAATVWNPNANSTVRALAVSGSTVYAGGEFTSIGGKARSGVAALDAASGVATAWNPIAQNGGYPDGGVDALAVSGSTVYAGGAFTRIGGQARNRIAALDATTGAATAWSPDADATVHAIAVSGSTVYVGGEFSHIGGQARNYLAALDATTGAATAWNPNVFYPPGPTYPGVYALGLGDSTIYAGGLFSSVGGQPRDNIAALDATTGAATAWSPDADATVHAIALSGSTVYAGGYFTSIGGQARDYIAALDAATGAAIAWNPSANSYVRALALSGSTVYAGGYFTRIGGQVRGYLAALDATTGAATAWNPGAGGTSPSVAVLAVSGSTVYTGGYFFRIGGLPQCFLAALEADSSVPVLLSRFEAHPQPGSIRVEWATATELSFAGFYLWRSEEGEIEKRLTPDLISSPEGYRFLDVDVIPGVTYRYRLEALDRTGSRQFFGPISARIEPGSGFGLQPILGQAFPNPVHEGSSTIPLTLVSAGNVRLRVLDLAGREIRVLLDEVAGPGEQSVIWDGRNERGEPVPVGIYFYQLQTAGFEATRKLARLR